MESNRDEAERCLELARAAAQRGDRVRARRLAVKSSTLYPSAAASALVSRLNATSPASTPDSPTPPPSSSSSARRAAPSSSAQRRRGRRSPSPAPATARQYTPEQAAVAREVGAAARNGDLYEVLGVARDADEDAIKRAYKRRALRLHPDKNAAPGAEEGFKKVAHAAQVLTDPQRRRVYDQTGRDPSIDPVGPAQGASGAPSPFHPHQEMSPEELFEMFFGGGGQATAFTFGPGGFHMRYGGPGARRAYPHPRPHPHPHHPDSAANDVLSKLPLIVFAVLVIFSYILTDNEPSPYSLDRGGSYTVPKTTTRGSLPYYVRRKPGDPSAKWFDQRYPLGSRARRNLEDSVERQTLVHLEDSCRHERIVKLRYQDLSKSWFRSRKERDEYARKADALPMASCHAYQRTVERIRSAKVR